MGSAGSRRRGASRARFVSTPPSPSFTMRDPVGDWGDYDEKDGTEGGEETPRTPLEAVRARGAGSSLFLETGEVGGTMRASPPGTPIVMCSTVAAEPLEVGDGGSPRHGLMEVTYANASTVVFVGGQEVDLDGAW